MGVAPHDPEEAIYAAIGFIKVVHKDIDERKIEEYFKQV